METTTNTQMKVIVTGPRKNFSNLSAPDYYLVQLAENQLIQARHEYRITDWQKAYNLALKISKDQGAPLDIKVTNTEPLEDEAPGFYHGIEEMKEDAVVNDPAPEPIAKAKKVSKPRPKKIV